MVAEEAPSAVDETPAVQEETSTTAAFDDGDLVAEAAEVVAIVEPAHVDEVKAVAGAAVTAVADAVMEPVALATVLAREERDGEAEGEGAEAVAHEPIADVRMADEPVAGEPIAEEPIADVRLADEPIADVRLTDEPIAEETIADVRLADEPLLEASAGEPAAEDAVGDAIAVSEPPLDADAEMDAELQAAMAQAEDANTAFATRHPEAVEDVPVAGPADDDERVEDEPWSPPPVMADPYYEYAVPADAVPESISAEQSAEGVEVEGPIVADEPLATSAGDRRADEALIEAPEVPPEVAPAAVDEPLQPELAAMAGHDLPLAPRSLSDEATIEAVAAAVEDTLAAEETPPPPIPTFRNPIPKVETPTDYVATPESMHALYQLQIDGFEGPLDLLLHLIKRHHLDIFDIPIAFICERYLEYLKAMEDVDIDVASEFLFMAAELLQLKSRMLLPRPEGEATEEEEIDPRAELVRRLLEYQKYKDVAERFGLLDRFGRDTFGREAEPTPPPEGEAPLKEVGLFALVKAFQACLDRQKPEVRHQVMLEQVSVRQRIRVLVQRFESQEPMRFESLLEDARRRIDIVVTFLALLEMGKLKLLRIFQSDDGVIYVHPKFDDVSLAFARLEGLDESQYAG